MSDAATAAGFGGNAKPGLRNFSIKMNPDTFVARDGYGRLIFPCGRYRDRDSKLDARIQALREIMQMPERLRE